MSTVIRGRGGLVVVLFLLATLVTVGDPVGQADAATDCKDPGPRIPVLFVHGFIGAPEDWTENTVFGPSLDTTVRHLPGVSVSTDIFDYQKASRDWVTDQAIGSALATRIDCLAELSRRHGGPGKVVVVAHSMGGLATRVAARETVDGRPVKDGIGLLIEIGTPHLGSIIATILKAAQAGSEAIDSAIKRLHDLGLSTSQTQTWVILAEAVQAARATCQQQGNARDQQYSLCWLVMIQQDTETRGAVQGLQLLSSELQALPALDASIPVLAIAGQIDVARVNIFGQEVRAGLLGDLVVDQLSASNTFVSGSRPPLTLRNVQAVGAHPEQGGGSAIVRCHLLATTFWAPTPLPASPDLGLACLHTSLPTNRDVGTLVAKAIRTFAAAHSVDPRNMKLTLPCGSISPQPLTVSIRDGLGRGPADATYSGGYTVGVEAVDIADLTGDGQRDIAVLLSCSGMPSNFSVQDVLILTEFGGVIAQLPKLAPLPGGTQLPPEFDAREFSIKNGRLVTGVRYYAGTDSHASGPSIHRKLTWRWDPNNSTFSTELPRQPASSTTTTPPPEATTRPATTSPGVTTPRPVVGLDVSSGPPGTLVTAGGTNFHPNRPVRITQSGGPGVTGGGATVQADAQGQFEITFRIADATPPGPITIRYTQAPDINVTDTFLVTAR